MLKLSLLQSKSFSSFIYTNQNVVKFAFATLNPTACCYDILGLKKNATANEIKQAYLSLVKKYHPDHNKTDPDAEEDFKILSKAYETLKDPTSRQIYDSAQNQSANFQKAQYRSSSYGQEYSQHYSQQYSDYSDKYQSQQSQRQSRNTQRRYHSARPESNAAIGSFISVVCLAMMVGFGLKYMFSSKNKPEDVRASDLPSQSGSPPIRNRGENSFEGIAPNNPLAFMRGKPISPEELQEEISKKQFRIEDATIVVRGSPEGEIMKKKWAKEDKKVVKDLEKTINKKGFGLKKSKEKQLQAPGLVKFTSHS